MNRIAREALKMKQFKKGPKVLPKDVIQSWKIFTGDEVQVISGDDKGHLGRILRVHRDKNLVIVAGANLMRKHVRTNVPNQGAIIDLEAGIHASNVALLDPVDRRPVRAEFMTIVDKDGKTRSARVSTRTGYEIPLPVFLCRVRTEGPFDTKPEVAMAASFIPDLRVPPLPCGCVI